MSKLSEMIATLCPNGVEYKKLGEVAEILDSKRKPVTKSDRLPGPYPYYGANGIQDYVAGYIFDGVYLLIGEDGSVITENGTPVLTWAEGKIWVNNHAHVIKELIQVDGTPMALLRYLYHSLQTVNISDVVRGTPPKLNKANLCNICIPLPPLPIQREIVQILDNFANLTAELTAELAKRKKQYEHYRDMLLNFTGGGRYDKFGNESGSPQIEWKRLGEIATDMYRGSGILRTQVTETGVPCVRYGEIYTAYGIWFDCCISHTKMEYVQSPKFIDKGDILFAITGESVEEIAKSTAYVGEERCLAGGDIVVMKHNQDPKYLSYALSTVDAQRQKSKGKVKSKVVHSSVPAIKDIRIPLPSLAEQKRIVAILDRFDSLCNSLTEGLPAEIALRKKQYEYYRDKLLNFKEAS